MASLISGFEYDIFISYRQKDNRHNGWVSEFVDQLKGELEATFKEDIGVYFDINPHDGLLDSHDVDASLKNKLKCLIFIPIISRTYCDPKSFAWEHEFMAFVDQASGDRFGLKVRLPGGNVANRVLPVRIHDLDSNDIKLCEAVLGGVLRGIEFIYKSAGVNRPLRLKEENPHDNLNHTIYRDQINKVANAISEIISGLQSIQYSQAEEVKGEISAVSGEQTAVTEQPVVAVPEEKVPKRQRKIKSIPTKVKIWIYSISSSVIVILTVVSLFLFTSGSILPFTERDWIIITDFENLTENPVFDKSLYTAFTVSISQSRYINILPRDRMYETMANMEIRDRTYVDEKTGRELAIRQGINIYIVPSISEAGNVYAIAAKIMEARSGNLLKSEIFYAETEDEILPALDKLSNRLRKILGESRYNIAIQDRPLVKATTSSLEALKQYTIGSEELALRQNYKGAKEYFENALRIDSGFTDARASLGVLNIENFDAETGRRLLSEAVKSVDRLTERERLNLLSIHAMFVENNLTKSIEYTLRLTGMYPDDLVYHNNLGLYYMRVKKFEEALKELKAALNIRPDLAVTYSATIWIYLQNLVNIDSAMLWTNKFISISPQNAWGHLYLGLAFISIDSIAKAETAFEKAREMDPSLLMNLYELAHIYRLQARYQEAISILEEIIKINKNDSPVYYNLGLNYQLAGNDKEAGKYYSIYKDIISEWMKKWPDDANLYIFSGKLSARKGDFESSEQMLRKASEIDSTLHKEFSEVLSVQGKIPEALDELEKALQSGYRELFWLKLNPDWQPLQYDIRFRNLLNKYFNTGK